MDEREELERAILAIEAQRQVLGDAVVESALISLREKLAALNEPKSKPAVEADKVEARRSALLSGERRVLTILFCDVKGSTAMAEQLDPEDWAGIIQQGLKFLTEPIQIHNGTVAEVHGDGILAFFGAPLAHEDDPQRAVLAGLEILEGIQSFQEQLRRDRGLVFDVRVGIHTGLVVVGEVGSEEQVEYTAIGDAVNLAARMEQTAQPGTVQISEQTFKLVEQLFEFEPLGALKVKGKRQPVETYRVTGKKAEPGPTRGLERLGLQSPMVGRAAEFSALMLSIDRLFAGQGGIVTIIGDAGIGKSRFVLDLHRKIPIDSLTWLEGNSLSYGQSIAYWPFQEILRCYADVTSEDDEDQAWRKLEESISALFPSAAITHPSPNGVSTVADILPYLASLLGLPIRGDYIKRVEFLDGEALGRQIYLATRRFFERLAAAGPVVLVFDDLQWVDESSAGLLKHVLPLVESLPLLIICLSRPYRDTPAAQLIDVQVKSHASQHTTILLTPLAPDEAAQLVRNLLDIEDLSEHVRQLIVSKADGNPFFLEEILRALIDLDAIHRDPSSGRWQATETIESVSLPDTVQGVILARLDRLEEEVKQVLRVAAVIGRSFLYRVLESVAEVGASLDAHLAELQKIELIQERQRLPEVEYLFKHALVQEATYESILFKKRRELHKQVGQVIERLFADRLEEFYSVLAYHYASAEAWELAQSYLIKAADQAGRMAADAEALGHYQQAKAAFDRAFGDGWDPVERASLERKMGEAFYRRGDMSRSLEYLRDSLSLLGNPLPKGLWAVRGAILVQVLQQVGYSILPNLYANREAGRAAEEELHTYQALVSILPGGDPELFLLASLRMLNASERNYLPVGIAQASAGMGIVCGFLNLHRLSEYYNRRAVRLAEQHRRPDVLGLVNMGRMQSSFFQSDRIEWDTVIEYGERAAEAFRETGNLGNYSVAISNAALVSLWRGNFAAVFARGQDLARLGQDSGDIQVWGSGLWLQGMVSQRLGSLEDAGACLNQAHEIAEAAGNNYLNVLVGNELGEWHLRRGDWQAALSSLMNNNHFLVEHNMNRDITLTSRLNNKLAWAYLMAAEQSDLGELKAWLKKAKRSCRTALKQGKTYRTAMPEAMRWRGLLGWLAGNQADARQWWLKSLTEAEKMEMPYEVGQAHLEIGQRMGERDHLEQAEAIFTEVGADLDLARTRELLTE